MPYECSTHLVADLKTVLSDARPKPRRESRRISTETAHCGDRSFQHPTCKASPTGMGGANNRSVMSCEQHRYAVSHKNCARDTDTPCHRGVRNQSPGSRGSAFVNGRTDRSAPRPATDLNYSRPMHLLQPRGLPIERQLLAHKPPILGHRFWRIAHVPAQVQ